MVQLSPYPRGPQKSLSVSTVGYATYLQSRVFEGAMYDVSNRLDITSELQQMHCAVGRHVNHLDAESAHRRHGLRKSPVAESC